MKSSVYKLSQGVYLADLTDRQIMRGSIEDLAAALVQAGVAADNLLLGDWRQGAELLSSSEQNKLRFAMTSGKEPEVTESSSYSSIAFQLHPPNP
jgi:hypothetical protein